ncbi:hypothetical protein CIT292_07547 [Citrobacter youngae ATCC 29220]|uniref:Uncharacterized protein n=1 Tax=Citrobacter youngae ATCC 29220 TaxID=500640 RepID=D4BAQ3_9ENTR|nr:hypothetical protein CIT292_07547 [Citrobacter youngae ATCC 29220]
MLDKCDRGRKIYCIFRGNNFIFCVFFWIASSIFITLFTLS